LAKIPSGKGGIFIWLRGWKEKRREMMISKISLSLLLFKLLAKFSVNQG
jgi:hypothetical protein